MASEQAEKFLRWVGPLGSGSAQLEVYANTVGGRERLAEAYVDPAHQLVAGVLGVRMACLRLEAFLACFPVEEQFSVPLIRIREELMELYGHLASRYEVRPSSYEGPRMSRYKRERVI